MMAYNGNPELKRSLIAQMCAHREAGALVQGVYWKDQKGCAVGCLTHDPEGGHERYERDWGIPVELAFLKDALFEGLPKSEAMFWPERFLGAIRPGADLTPVWPRFSAWLLALEILRYVNISSDCKEVVLHSASLLQRIGDRKIFVPARVVSVIVGMTITVMETASSNTLASEASLIMALAKRAAERSSKKETTKTHKESEREVMKRIAYKLKEMLEEAK